MYISCSGDTCKIKGQGPQEVPSKGQTNLHFTYSVQVLYNALKGRLTKKMQLYLGIFYKGGWGFWAHPKVLGHFFVPQQFGRNGGGMTQTKSFGHFFPKLLVKYDTLSKSAPKVTEKPSQRKSAPKVPKFLGEGGWGSLENTQIKALFFVCLRTSLRLGSQMGNNIFNWVQSYCK